MAERLVALIRGINVGRAKRIAMADLRALVEGLGYCDVATLLNSGNVVFTGSDTEPAEAATLIEKALEARLGVAARVIVLTAPELAEIVRENPLLGVADNPSRLIIAVLFNPDDRSRISPLAASDWAPERMALGRRAAYLWCPDGVLSSRLPEAIGRAVADGVTTRNWRTILKIHAFVDSVR